MDVVIRIAALIALTLLGFTTGVAQNDGAARKYLRTEFDVPNGAVPISFFRNGDMIAVIYDQKDNKKGEYVVTIWDIPNKKLLSTFKTPFGFISNLDTSPNDKLILISDSLGNNNIYSKDGKLVSAFRVFEFGGNTHLDIKFISDEEVLVVTKENIVVRRNIVTNVSKLYYLNGRFANGATISNHTNTLSWVNSVTVYIWSPMLTDGNSVEIRASDNEYNLVACSDDGSRLLCAEQNSQFALYNVKEKKLIKKWNGHNGATSVQVFPIVGNKGFVTGCEDGEVKVWRQDGELAATIILPDNERIYTIAGNRDSSVLAIGIGTLKIIGDGKKGSSFAVSTPKGKIRVYDLKRMVEGK